MTELSVVLTTKNQAWNATRLIESVLEAISRLSSTEVTLVDSASADETVELARCYPVSILRLRGGAATPLRSVDTWVTNTRKASTSCFWMARRAWFREGSHGRFAHSKRTRSLAR